MAAGAGGGDVARRKSPYTPEQKAAVLAAIAAGTSFAEIRRTYGVSKDTCARWAERAGLRNDLHAVSDRAKEELGALVLKVVNEILATMAFQARFFRGEAWLEKQSAGDAAILFGVISDKAVRILSSLQSADDGPAGGTAVDPVYSASPDAAAEPVPPAHGS